MIQKYNMNGNKRSAGPDGAEWICKHFTELTNNELYQILKLRSEIFVVEQNCAYQDCDDMDQDSYHLMHRKSNRLIAYSRLLKPNTAFAGCSSIGRVVVKADYRKTGVGIRLMEQSVITVQKLFGSGYPIAISAQHYLLNFYSKFGFAPSGPVYDEDGIPHIAMFRAVSAG